MIDSNLHFQNTAWKPGLVLKRSSNVFMDVWFEDGMIQGVGYPFVSLTRVSNVNSGYDLLLSLLLALHVIFR